VSGPGELPNAGPPPGAPEPPQISSGKLMGTLTVAGALAGVLLVLVFQATAPAIAAYKEQQLQLAVSEVLHGPARFETLYVVDGELLSQPPEGVDPKSLERVYVGYDESGAQVGFAVAAAKPGYQDWIRLMYGYDPAGGRLLGMKVLESKETPGLGDRIEKDADFVGQFDGPAVPLVGYKAGESEEDAHGVDMITGATISSKTIINAINESLERLSPLMADYRGSADPGGAPPAEGSR
jgi:electron transport complex protein RnfG